MLPSAGETCAQWSSYDRASTYDEKTGKYVHWDANGDGNGIIRTEGDMIVMAEMKGPGCIWRTWSAAPGKGRVKIYLDDQPEPTIDMPFAHYFDGKHAPFAFPALSYNLADVGSSGQNLYLPIPYHKSCKIVAEKDWGAYYHFNYVTYPAGTELPTFSAELAEKNADALRTVNDFFTKGLGTDPAGTRPGQEKLRRALRIAPGQAAVVAKLSGARAITALWAKATFADRAEEIAALRKLALRITWDGQAKPAVWCPLGDFFGTAPGINLFKTLPMGMTAEGFYSYWYMPFAESAVVELVNDDATAREVDFEITHAPLGRPFEGFGHFHAKWHRDTVELPKDRWPDWTMLQTEGRGRFCGVLLHVWNPRGGWWGEGDEKFFVDGEQFPSTFGTGSEDYFGYAWGNAHLFQMPYHCQTMTQGNRGHQAARPLAHRRKRAVSEIVRGLHRKVFQERSGHAVRLHAPLVPRAGGEDPYGALPAEQRDGYYSMPQMTVAGLKVLNEPQGDPQVQDMEHFGGGKWKDNVQLWWTGAHPKDRLVLGFPVAKDGKYEVSVNLTKASDYAIVQLSLDDRKVGDPIDLYNPTVVPTGPIALDTCELTAGQHKLTIEIVGANPKARKSYLFGIDRIELKAAQ